MVSNGSVVYCIGEKSGVERGVVYSQPTYGYPDDPDSGKYIVDVNGLPQLYHECDMAESPQRATEICYDRASIWLYSAHLAERIALGVDT